MFSVRNLATGETLEKMENMEKTLYKKDESRLPL